MTFKQHFKHNTNHRQYHADFTNITYIGLQNNPANANKDSQKVLQKLFNTLQLSQQALRPVFQNKEVLYTAIIQACSGVPEFNHALYIPAEAYK